MKQDLIYKYDQFFTKENIAIDCINDFKTLYELTSFNLIIEPSCGIGSFYYNLPKELRLGIEIDKNLCMNTDFLCKDFLLWRPESKNKIAVIGNPPFGTQNSNSIKFFNHAAKFSDVIAFIIPKTWNNNSIQNRLNLNFWLVHNKELPNNCFFGEKTTEVKCCFQIWERKPEKRKKHKQKTIHPDWDFLSYKTINNELIPPENADFIILAYGSNPGQISDNLYRWRPKSVHYIKANIDVKKLKERFKHLNYETANNSARQGSLGKGKLIDLYESSFNND